MRFLHTAHGISHEKGAIIPAPWYRTPFHHDHRSTVFICQHFLLQPNPPPKPPNMPGQISIMTTMIMISHHIQLHPKPRPKPLSSSVICLTPFRNVPDNSSHLCTSGKTGTCITRWYPFHYIVLSHGVFCYPRRITFIGFAANRALFTADSHRNSCTVPVASSFE